MVAKRKRKKQGAAGPNPIVMGIVLIALLVLAYFLFFSRQTNMVEIRDNAPWYFPAIMEIEPGTIVTWKLNSPAVHPVMQLEGPVEFHSGHFTDTWSYKFDSPGLYVYICPIHPYMRGVIGVGQKVPKEKIPLWVDWPLPNAPAPGGKPSVPGIGKIWLDAQFEERAGKEKPGVIYIIDAETWEVEETLTDNRINNPHNLVQVGKNVLQTQWFDKYLSVIDVASKRIIDHIYIGESPAHVMPGMNNQKIYVTIQGDDGMAILDSRFNVLDKKRGPKGPHGNMMSADGKRMAVAHTEDGKITVWDLEKDEIIFEHELVTEKELVSHDEEVEEHPHTLPLMAGLTPDGKFAFAGTSNEGKFYVFDVEEKELAKVLDIGKGPIQVGVSPDGKYVLVPLTFDSAVAVISIEDWEMVKKIPNVGLGAHGVAFGPKQGGGDYAYVSNKFTTWVTVINLDSLEVAGYIPLPATAWGGQGIIVIEKVE